MLPYRIGKVCGICKLRGIDSRVEKHFIGGRRGEKGGCTIFVTLFDREGIVQSPSNSEKIAIPATFARRSTNRRLRDARVAKFIRAVSNADRS